ncbi:hypothetical protein HPP92_019220 [Vanilla planifolia]|uniref:Uncharacterized protein n=1 Tax=Vanilla planifolia TaxID=51239 RepID=A0A835UMP8_VANPL|nr:hypothetical protein HPP92_019220 [Vanilla planifolia]
MSNGYTQVNGKEGIERPKRMIKGALLDGVANTGAVDVANVQKFFLNSGMHKMPSIVASLNIKNTIYQLDLLSLANESQGRIQKTLRDDADANGNKVSVEASAAVAAMARRLSFAWLDGGVQKIVPFILDVGANPSQLEGINKEDDDNKFKKNGNRGMRTMFTIDDYDSKDVPRLFIVRYKRNSVEHELRPKKKPNSFWSAFDKENSNLASQIVAVYNGTVDIQEIGAAPALIRGINYLHIKEYSEYIFHWQWIKG